jgi:hypothetical protein
MIIAMDRMEDEEMTNPYINVIYIINEGRE